MIFATHPEIGDMVLQQLRDATEVYLAVAYFNPDDRTMSAFRKVPHLTLIISEEFTINDPNKILRLSPTATIRSISPDNENGKLHAKVLIVKKQDIHWVMVGSANFTWQGLFANQEACIILESQNPTDVPTIEQVTDWFDVLLQDSNSPNLETARRIFDTHARYRLETRSSETPNETKTSYWALKCPSGAYGQEHWHSFLAESVIAVGWPAIEVDPSAVSKYQLQDSIASVYDDEDAGRAAGKIKKFVEMNVGDIVVICRGYPANSTKPVTIYGFARVTGPFRDDPSSSWHWRFKHDAVIQPVETQLPKSVVAAALGKGSLLGAINQLDRNGIHRLVEYLGVSFNI